MTNNTLPPPPDASETPSARELRDETARSGEYCLRLEELIQKMQDATNEMRAAPLPDRG